MTTFPTTSTPDIEGLLKQLDYYHKPQGGKRTAPALPPPIDLTSPSTVQSPAVGGTPAADGEEDGEDRPRKKSRLNGDAKDKDPKASPRQGKKPGKGPAPTGAGKGTKPRTVVRGTRGLVPMETEADGDQHEAGQLPESAKADGEEIGAEEEEEEEDEVPLAAQRPQLDEQERQRRVMLKEKEREREDEVTRRITKAEETAMEKGIIIDADFWEGVELVSPRFLACVAHS